MRRPHDSVKNRRGAGCGYGGVSGVAQFPVPNHRAHPLQALSDGQHVKRATVGASKTAAARLWHSFVTQSVSTDVWAASSHGRRAGTLCVAIDEDTVDRHAERKLRTNVTEVKAFHRHGINC